VVNGIVFAVPGDLATPTGGYAYDRRMIGELTALGWTVELIDLGSGFPQPTAEIRATVANRLGAMDNRCPIVIDGLAFGVLPELAERMRESHRLVALVHHPLALETGLSAYEAVFLRASEQRALSCASHVIATSAATMSILAQDFQVPVERMSVVEPGTDMAAFAPHQPGDAIGLLSVGAVVPRKGYDVLVAALDQIRELRWRLLIAGDCTRSTATTSELQTQIERLGFGDRIDMRGALSPEQVAALYSSSDIFVLASRFEGYGMAFTEALAHGLPVVGTTVGAAVQNVPQDAGVLVPVDNADALASALRHLMENPQERERLAAGARAVTFPSWREQAERFARVLQSLA
jgi:glycosyltransferase involved in cell wall biosynthesis